MPLVRPAKAISVFPMDVYMMVRPPGNLHTVFCTKAQRVFFFSRLRPPLPPPNDIFYEGRLRRRHDTSLSLQDRPVSVQSHGGGSESTCVHPSLKAEA